MSYNRGAAGAAKPKLLNVNTVYAGKTAGGKALGGPGNSKHGGLQSLGKATAVVRRMPPPATLPSLRAESQGQDPNVALVPQGGSGWNKSDTPDSSECDRNTLKNGGSSTAGSNLAHAPFGAGTVGQSQPPHAATDLRPNWAKPAADAASGLGSVTPNAATAGGVAVAAAGTRDFPTLAASVASQNRSGGPEGAGSLKPQKSGSWKAGGVSTKEGADTSSTEPRDQPPYPSSQSATGKANERQLPARYGPDSQPMSAYGQQQQRGSSQYGGGQHFPKGGSPQDGGAPSSTRYSRPPPPIQHHNDVRYSQQQSLYHAASAYPPGVGYASQSTRSGHGEEGYETGGGYGNGPTQMPHPPQQSRYPPYERDADGGRGGQPPAGYGQPSQTNQGNFDYPDREECGWSEDESSGRRPAQQQRRMPPPQQPPLYQQQQQQYRYREDQRYDGGGGGGRGGADWYSSEQHQQYVGTGPWYAHGTANAPAQPPPLMAIDHRNTNTSGYGPPPMYPPHGPPPPQSMNAPPSNRDLDREEADDERRKAYQEQEREAAIQRSRQKRRLVNQTSLQSDHDYPPASYHHGGDQQQLSDVERPNSRDSYGQRSQGSSGKHGGNSEMAGRQQRNDYDARGGRRSGGDGGRAGRGGGGTRRGAGLRGDAATEEHPPATHAPQPEIRVLKRPDSKESTESASGGEHAHRIGGVSRPPPHHQPQSHLQHAVDEEETNDEDDLQLTQLSRTTTKVIKRVAPGHGSASRDVASVGQAEEGDGQARATGQQSSLEAKTVQARTANGKENKSPSGTPSDKSPFPSTTTAKESTAIVQPAPPPPDNIWERRAEERESAERERQMQHAATTLRSSRQTQHLQAHFPAVNETPPVRPPSSEFLLSAGSSEFGERQSSDARRFTQYGNYGQGRSQDVRGNRQSPYESRLAGGEVRDNGGLPSPGGFHLPPPSSQRFPPPARVTRALDADDEADYEGEDERGRGAPFRGQREFVNSRVAAAAARAGRGLSVGSTRGRVHHHAGVAVTAQRSRGASAPHGLITRSSAGVNRQAHAQRRIRPETTEEEQEDNFSNMGEFHAEDVIYASALQKSPGTWKTPGSDSKTGFDSTPATGDDVEKDGGRLPTKKADGEGHVGGMRSGQRGGGTKTASRQRTVRASQPLYQPHVAGESQGHVQRGARNTRNTGRHANRNHEGAGDASGDAHFERGKRKHETGSGIAQNGAMGDAATGGEAPQGHRRTGSQQYSSNTAANTQSRRRGGRSTTSTSHHSSNAHHPTSDPTTPYNRGGQLKSPAMSEGPEEWETASESSDVAGRVARKAPQAGAKGAQATGGDGDGDGGGTGSHRRHPGNPRGPPRRDRVQRGNGRRNEAGEGERSPGGQANGKGSAMMSGSKNVRPASHTHFTASGLPKRKGAITEGENRKAPSAERDDVDEAATALTCNRGDGLAGVDINNAGVIVIDDHPDVETSDVEHHEFEEVLSKKARRARQQQLNEQAELEKMKRLKEKEKMEKAQARRAKLLSRRNEKKAARSTAVATRAHPASGDSDGTSTPIVQTSKSTGAGITTVWNSAHVDGMQLQQDPALANHPVIPSPIARPTKGLACVTARTSPGTTAGVWTAPTDDNDTGDEMMRGGKTVEFPANFTATSTTANETATSEKYDFTFDPSLQQASTGEDTAAIQQTAGEKGGHRPPSANSHHLIASDDAQLKEKLDKVKDIWPGQQPDFSTSALLTSTSTPSLVENATLLVAHASDKSQNAINSNAGASSLAQGPNVAKVRPQPQTQEQTGKTVVAAGGGASGGGGCASMQQAVMHSQAINVAGTAMHVAPGIAAYGQAYPPYSLMMSANGEMMQSQAPQFHQVHPAASPPAQAQMQMFGPSASITNVQAQQRSRPTSFIEPNAIFMHPPPAGTGGPLWSAGPGAMEVLAGMNATPPHSATASPHFQFSSVMPPRSNTTAAYLTAPPPATGGKMPPPGHMTVPPPHHSHHLAAFTMHPPPNIALHHTDFMSIPPPLGPVGSQRPAQPQMESAASQGARFAPQQQHQLAFAPSTGGQQTQLFSSMNAGASSGFVGASAAVVNPMQAHFSAPPPQMRFTRTGESANAAIAAWNKPHSAMQQHNAQLGPFGIKFGAGVNAMQAPPPAVTPIGRPALSGPPGSDRWMQNPQQPFAMVQPVFNSGSAVKDVDLLLPPGGFIAAIGGGRSASAASGGSPDSPLIVAGVNAVGGEDSGSGGNGGESNQSLTPADSIDNLSAMKKAGKA